ncbi:DUF6493 family protein [Streptomyces sp. NPDC005963]|uniref:DUF7824 domain-containing protein n=1 Tax=Streptomyces sp. NPDC005963 TaxID=3156721 RepID=UPI0033F257A6
MSKVLEAVAAGHFKKVPSLLKPLGPAERKACLAELKALRVELRQDDRSRWPSWRERNDAAAALLVAGAGCHTGAAAAASWLGARDLRTVTNPPRDVIVEVLKDRDADWLADVAHRLAARASTAQEDHWLIRRLVELSGCPVPTTDGYVYGWVDELTRSRSGALYRLRDRLAADPHTPLLVPRLFETPQLPGSMVWFTDPDTPAHWPSVLVGLTEDGTVERTVVVDACVARLLRGGKPGELRFFLGLLRRLELTPEEEASRVPDWQGMAADGSTPVAAIAQSVLARLAETGALSTRSLAEVSSAVFFRTEKKLVTAQLSLLGKVLRPHTQLRRKAGAKGAADKEYAESSAAVHELLPVVGEAFGHDDVIVQERALKLVSRHLLPADDDLRGELASSAMLLSPVHRAAATELFGVVAEASDPSDHVELLPVVPEPVRLAPPAVSSAELVAELSVVVRSGLVDPGAFERALDGLVRLVHREREPLLAELRSAMAHRWWAQPHFSRLPHLDTHFERGVHGVDVVAAALLGRISDRAVQNAQSMTPSPSGCPYSGLAEITRARIWEVALLVKDGTVPFLLSTPTWENGVLDPAVLVERLREYDRLGIEPAPADFTQALLRATTDDGEWDPGVVAEAAAGLGTEGGDRLALWLTGEGPVLRALQPELEEQRAESVPATEGGLLRHPARATRRLLDRARARRAIQQELPAAFRWLSKEIDPRHQHFYGCFNRYSSWQSVVPHWPAVVPHHREALASWLVPGLLETMVADIHGDSLRGGAWCLPRLAEGAAPNGPAGWAMHRALAAGLGVRVADDRLTAVDALLVLAVRGQLDPALLGRELGDLVAHGHVKPNRITDALGTAAATGAHRTVWSVLAGALPGLLASPKAARAMGGLLAVAANCVEQCGPQITTAMGAGPSAPTAEPAGASAAFDGEGSTTIAAGPEGVGPSPRAGSGPEEPTGSDAQARPEAPADPEAQARRASVHGADGRIPGLAELAGRGGSSQAVVQAARLLGALG